MRHGQEVFLTAAGAAWLAVLIGIGLLSFLPISADLLPGGAQSWLGIGHALAYGLHAVLLLRVLRAGWPAMGYPQAASTAAVSTLLLGGAIELLQPYLGRTRDLMDFAMNALGILVALGLLSLVRGRALVRGTGRSL